MAEDLSELFAEQRTNIVEWDGGLLYGLYEFASLPDRFTVEFLSGSESPVQGLNIKISGGLLVVNDTEADDVVLWRDTAPDVIEVQVKKRPRATTSLKAWNIWRVKDVTHAWLGNSAIRVDEDHQSATVVLHCSDGEGPPSFDDLVVRLRLG